MPYCGCKSSLNKKLWCLATTAALLCVACVIAYVVTGTKCFENLDDAGCVENRGGGYRITPSNNNCIEDNYDGVCRAVYPVIWLAILFFILATVPCCIMCCCAPKPKAKYHDAPVAHTHGGGHGHHAAAGSYDTYGTGGAHQPTGTYDAYGGGGAYDYSGSHATGGQGYGKPGGDVYDQYGGAPEAHHGGYTKPTHHSPAV